MMERSNATHVELILLTTVFAAMTVYSYIIQNPRRELMLGITLISGISAFLATFRKHQRSAAKRSPSEKE